MFDAPIGLSGSEEPLGTHVYFAQSFKPTDERTQWLAMTTEPAEDVDAFMTRSIA